MQLVAPRAAPLEAGNELVDEPLGVAEFGRGHPVELAVLEHLAPRVRVGGDDEPVDLLAGALVVVAGRRDRGAPFVGPVRHALIAGLRCCLAGRVVALAVGPVGMLEDRGLEVARPATAGPPPAIEHDVVRLAIIAASDEHGLTRRSNLLARPDIDERQRPSEVHGSGKVDVEPGGAERPPEPDRLMQEAPPIDLRTPRGRDDGGIVRSLHAVTLP